jgi:hypothetical protein
MEMEIRKPRRLDSRLKTGHHLATLPARPLRDEDALFGRCVLPRVRLKVSPDSLRWRPSMVLRGLDALPLEFDS